MECVNLRERWGSVYKVTVDEACEVRDDPWMWQIPCELGVIYPHGGFMLAVEVDWHPLAWKRLAVVEGVELWQDGDGEKTFIFPEKSFEAVAGIVRPRKRRKLTPEQRAAAVARLSVFKFATQPRPENRL